MGTPSTSVEVSPQLAELDIASAITLQALEKFDEEVTNETGMWIFGYGSLCWNPGFSFEKSLTGFVRGFSRKFWQGNTTHRGTQKKPGRVATLVEEEDVSKKSEVGLSEKYCTLAFYVQPFNQVVCRTTITGGIVWGQAFQVRGQKAFSYLNSRECELGGYLTTITTFYPRQDVNDDKCLKPFPAILYLATPSNSLWLGDSPLAEIANQILECNGSSGHNVEYLLRLATFVRKNIPEAIDDHLFSLEWLVRSKIKERNLCLRTLMGEKKIREDEPEDGETEMANEDVEVGERDRTDCLQFISTIPSKKLQCVNI